MTKLKFALLGHPVGHSMSPQIHAEVYRAHALPHEYTAIDCPDEQSVSRAIERLRTGELAGLNVTVPWKRVALRLADVVDPSAATTLAANVLMREPGGRIVAHNTDVPALAECVKRGAPRAHGDAIVLGNGGAALAAVVACKNSGSEKVWVSARSWQSSLPKAEWRDVGEFRALGAEPFTWDKPWELAPFAAARCVVQATSAGMRGKGGGQELAAWLPWSELPRDCFVYDVVYNPPSTPLLERARKDGLPCEGGLSMLVGQAALAVRLWLGIEAPRQAMQELAARLLAEQNP